MRLTEDHVASPSQSRSDWRGIVEAYRGAALRLTRTHAVLADEVRRLRAELASANSALQRSQRLAALGEMAAGIAHEVRNPLASIRLYAGILEDELRNESERCAFAKKIIGAVRGLDAVVGDVLAFSSELVMHPVTAPFTQALRAALDDVRGDAESGLVTVINEVEPCLRAPHDPELLRRALVNLLRNAIQACPRGGQVRVGGRMCDGAVSLFVRDTGPGIAESDVERVFNPFFTTRTTGTGLGLSIVHRIIDAHGGSISVHNDGGAVFTLTFPCFPTEVAA